MVLGSIFKMLISFEEEKLQRNVAKSVIRFSSKHINLCSMVAYDVLRVAV